jgi:hypothetical protein
MRQRIIDLVFILSLIGTIVAGGYVMYQINTTDFKGIITGRVSK